MVGQRYRSKQMKFWQDMFPDMRKNYNIYLPPVENSKPKHEYPKIVHHPTSMPIYRANSRTPPNIPRTPLPEVFGTVLLSPEDPAPGNIESPSVGQTTQKSGWTKNTLIILGGVFLAVNLILFLALYYKCTKKKKCNIVTNNSDDPINVEENSTKAIPAFDTDGCNFLGMIVKASKSEGVKVSEDASSSKAKLTRNVSNSTLDAHTKVRDWITQEIVQKCSPAILRRYRDAEQGNLSRIKPPLIRSDSKTVESCSTLGRSPTRPVTPAVETLHSPKIHSPIISKKSVEKCGFIPKLYIPDKVKHKHKADKVSVAIDATPSGRGSSVMKQQPIELTKSLDCTSSGVEKEIPLRRSVTLDDICSAPKTATKAELRKSSTSINIQYKQMQEPTMIKIMHFHSKSDPVQDLYNFTPPPKLRTFTPEADVNVTSIDDSVGRANPELTPEQALMTIKRRNFPKVLPDLPAREALIQKRRSMPAPNAFFPISTGRPYLRSPNGKPHLRLAPVPPPRTSSTLPRQETTTTPICHSAPVLAVEPPLVEEPELTCNNLYFGPLKKSKESLKKFEQKSLQDTYEGIKPQRPTEPKPEMKSLPKTIITTDPDRPIKRMEPKVVIKPKIARNVSKNTGITRVTATDNATYVNISDLNPKHEGTNLNTPSVTHLKTDDRKLVRQSHIPTKIKFGEKYFKHSKSSSESTTPSEESDTGTVVKNN